MFEAVALDFAGGIDEEFFAAVEAVDDGADEGLDLLARALAVLDEVGDLEGVDEAHEGVEVKGLVHEADDEGAQRNLGTELGHDEDGVDVAGMIGQDEDGAVEVEEGVEAFDFDAITEPGERAADVTQEELDEHGTSGALPN